MTFKELKSGYPIYLLDRNSLTYSQAKVMAISMPHADRQTYTMMIDITIQSDGKQNTYSVSENECIAYAGSLLIASDKQHIVNDVKSIQQQAEDTLSKVDELKMKVSTCQALLAELDTTFRDKQETEKRFQSIEEKMDKILTMLNKESSNSSL